MPRTTGEDWGWLWYSCIQLDGCWQFSIVSEARCEQVHWNPRFIFLAAQETDLTKIREISQRFLYLLRKRNETFSGLLTFRLCYSFSSAVRGLDANNSRFYLFLAWILVMHCHQLSTIRDITEVQDHVSCQLHCSVGNKIIGKCQMTTTHPWCCWCKAEISISRCW